MAESYLTRSELAQLWQLVKAYLDVAESIALRMIPITMQDWETRLNRLLDVTDHAILTDGGKVTAEIGLEEYSIVQDLLFEGDFEQVGAGSKRLGEGTTKVTTRKERKP